MSRGRNPDLKKADITKTPFLFMQADPQDYQDAAESALQGIQQQTVLSTVFFSPQNIALIQKQIIKTVLIKSNWEYMIEQQSNEDLLVVMRSMFLQHARHLPDNIPKQIRELNNYVVDEVVPGIIDQIQGQIGYLKKTFGPMEVIAPPISVHKTKVLPSYF